jgi:hypothetical protein
MATLAGTTVTGTTDSFKAGGHEYLMHIGVLAANVILPFAFLMRAQDQGRAAGSNYTVWVSGSADFAGAGYATGVPVPTGAMVAGSVVVTRIY